MRGEERRQRSSLIVIKEEERILKPVCNVICGTAYENASCASLQIK